MAKEDKKAKKAAKKEEKAAKKANRTPDPEFKNSLIKCIGAVVCVAAICITSVSGVGKIADAKISAAEAAANPAAASDSADEGAPIDETAGYDDTAAPVDDGTADAGTDDTAAPADEETAADTGSSEAATEAGKTDNGGSASKTMSTAEVIKLYNSVTAKTFNAKVPFTKERNTTEDNYDAGVALKASKSIVFKFMGVGDDNKFSKTVTKEDKDSYHKYFQASKLTAADVTSATCTEAGGKQTIVINIKDGASSVKGGQVVNSNNAPLDRAGLACGDNDKDYWDHKTAENVMSAIDDVPACKSANIAEKYTNAKITAVVDAKTGNLISLTAFFKFHFDLDDVMGSSGTADSSSTVIMKDFKW